MCGWVRVAVFLKKSRNQVFRVLVAATARFSFSSQEFEAASPDHVRAVCLGGGGLIFAAALPVGLMQWWLGLPPVVAFSWVVPQRVKIHKSLGGGLTPFFGVC